MSGKRRGQSGPDGKSYSQAVSEKVPNDPEGQTWADILHGLDEDERGSERKYQKLTQPLSPEDLENLPYPEPIPAGLGQYRNSISGTSIRKEFWTEQKEKIWPYLTETEKKVFLRIIHTPKIQNWEIAENLELTVNNVYVVRNGLEKKIRQIYGNS